MTVAGQATLLGGLNAGEPTPLTGTGGTVSLVEGSTFCLSDNAGDVIPGTSHGLYFRDTRLVSRWALRLDGQSPHPLSVISEEAFTARFVLRRPPRPGERNSTVLLVRERLVADGLHETITVHNHGAESTAVTLTLEVAADFADMFAVRAGTAAGPGVEATVNGTELRLRDPADPDRGVLISAPSDAVVVSGVLSWRLVVPPAGQWRAEVVVAPLAGNEITRPASGGDRGRSGPAQRIQRWRASSAVLAADDPTLNAVLARSTTDLGTLQVEDPALGGHRFVAAGAPWYMTLFGRDSLLAAWMALPLDVGLAVGTVRNLAASQGARVDPATEEQPGRILHELRLGPDSARVLGGSHYYGTVDATPLFVMLLAECWRWGADPGAVRDLLPAADAALSWIDEHGDRDGDGFVEYQRATDHSLVNQGWKDSADAINDAEGRLADPPIALCEVQGYTYAALLARAELAEAFGDPVTAARFSQRAEDLRARFAEAFWLADRGWYAVALDRRKQPVDALTSNAAHCLWTGIACDEHAARLIERLADQDMDTGYGLRTLASSMGAYNPMSYHNGSVWPHDTAIAVAGLLRYAHLPGAVALATRLATGVMDAAAAFGGRLPELYCGFSRGQFNSPVPYPTSCSPQAWASGAPLLLVRSLLGLDPHVPRRQVTIRPHLPTEWGRVTVDNLRIGQATLKITAKGERVAVHGLPSGWDLDTQRQV